MNFRLKLARAQQMMLGSHWSDRNSRCCKVDGRIQAELWVLRVQWDELEVEESCQWVFC